MRCKRDEKRKAKLAGDVVNLYLCVVLFQQQNSVVKEGIHEVRGMTLEEITVKRVVVKNDIQVFAFL